MCRSHIPSFTQSGQQMWKDGTDIRLFLSVTYLLLINLFLQNSRLLYNCKELVQLLLLGQRWTEKGQRVSTYGILLFTS
jgi:hypothetical protein